MIEAIIGFDLGLVLAAADTADKCIIAADHLADDWQYQA